MKAARNASFLVLVLSRTSVLAFVPGTLSLRQPAAQTTGSRVRLARESCVRPLNEARQDGGEEGRRSGFALGETDSTSTPERAGANREGQGRTRRQTVNRRLLEQIQEEGKGIKVDDGDSTNIARQEEDLNGVNPLFAFAAAGTAGAMSIASWTAMEWFAQRYFTQPPDENEIQLVQRISTIVKQVVVGLFALGAGIFGLTAVGIAVMAGIVAVGVAKGELDPSAEASTSARATKGPEGEEGALIDQAQARLVQAQEDIEREIGGRL